MWNLVIDVIHFGWRGGRRLPSGAADGRHVGSFRAAVDVNGFLGRRIRSGGSDRCGGRIGVHRMRCRNGGFVGLGHFLIEADAGCSRPLDVGSAIIRRLRMRADGILLVAEAPAERLVLLAAGRAELDQGSVLLGEAVAPLVSGAASAHASGEATSGRSGRMDGLGRRIAGCDGQLPLRVPRLATLPQAFALAVVGRIGPIRPEVFEEARCG